MILAKIGHLKLKILKIAHLASALWHTKNMWTKKWPVMKISHLGKTKILILFFLFFWKIFGFFGNFNGNSSCDLTETQLFGQEVSCSAILNSDWATGFGLIGPLIGRDSILNQPNYHFGMLFYLISMLSSFYGWRTTNRLLSLGGAGAVLFFSYAMYDIGKLCIACILGKFSHLDGLHVKCGFYITLRFRE